MKVDLKNLDESLEAPLASEEMTTTDQLYLEKLTFHPRLRRSWLNFFVTRYRVVLMIIVFLTALGVYAYTQLPRESNPEVKIPYAAVVTVYPGASPSDIEELVTKKLEAGISGIKGVKQITSTSQNSSSMIMVEFDAKEDLEGAIRKLRDEVVSLKGRLPADALEPVVQEISVDDTPIWTFSLSGPYDGFALRDMATQIKDELERVSSIREVLVSGGDERQFQVDYDSSKLSFYHLSPAVANNAIAARNSAIPAGMFEGEEYSYAIRTDGQIGSLTDLQNTPLWHSPEGAIIYLKDVATVSEAAIKKTSYSRLSQEGSEPQNSITFQVIKKTGGNIIEAVDEGEMRLQNKLKELPSGLSYSTTLDMSEMVEQDFNQLAHDFLMTIILVFTILFLIVGIKEAFVAGLAIPLVFFGTFAVMLYSGISLNFLSLYSLILALGLLVDDAIVVVSATKQYLKSGKFTPEEAVLLVLNDFKGVLTTTTLTTVWAFLPLLLVSGIMGEYLKSIPITVSTTLILSLIIALIINHPLAAVLERIRFTKSAFLISVISLLAAATLFGIYGGTIGLIVGGLLLIITFVFLRWYWQGGRTAIYRNSKLVAEEWEDDNKIKLKLATQAQKKNNNLLTRILHGVIHFDRILPVYERYLRRVVSTKKARRRFIGVASILFIIALSFPISGLVKYEFFPKSDFEYMFIDIEAPSGLKLSETDKIVSEVESRLVTYPEIRNFSTVVGVSSNSSFIGTGSSGSSKASITIRLKPLADRELRSYELADKMNGDFQDIVSAKVTITSLEGGPPAGAPFEAQIQGDELPELERIAKDLAQILGKINGVASTELSLKETPADYTFILDPARLELYDLNAAYVGSTLRLAISGMEVTTVLDEGEEIKVIAQVAENKLDSLEALQNFQITNLKGQPVFLKDVAKVELKPATASISRIDQRRSVSLTATLTAQGNSTQVFQDFQRLTKDYQMPSGYEIKYGGVSQENTDSVTSMAQAMIVAFLLIIITLIIQFNSFKQTAIILVTIPLALIGVSFGLAIVRIPLSMPGLIGVLALFGIVVKNAIILVDKMNLNLRSGIPFLEAVIDAGKSRLEAIFITSLSTIFGLLPITLSSDMWRALGTSVISGLLLSSFLTLFMVPTLYVALVKPPKK